MTRHVERTSLQDLERTILFAVADGDRCIVSDERLEGHLGGLSEAQRTEWREDFCREAGLTTGAVPGGVMFERLGI